MAPVEGWRANVPLFRAIATSVSILFGVAVLSWQGSQWVSDIRSEMREVRTTLSSISRGLEEKAAVKDIEHRFALMCARAPATAKAWACVNAK